MKLLTANLNLLVQTISNSAPNSLQRNGREQAGRMSRDELRNYLESAVERRRTSITAPTPSKLPAMTEWRKNAVTVSEASSGQRSICSTETWSCVERQVWQDALVGARVTFSVRTRDLPTAGYICDAERPAR